MGLKLNILAIVGLLGLKLDYFLSANTVGLDLTAEQFWILSFDPTYALEPKGQGPGAGGSAAGGAQGPGPRARGPGPRA